MPACVVNGAGWARDSDSKSSSQREAEAAAKLYSRVEIFMTRLAGPRAARRGWVRGRGVARPAPPHMDGGGHLVRRRDG
jgi:hypothetical protein